MVLKRPGPIRHRRSFLKIIATSLQKHLFPRQLRGAKTNPPNPPKCCTRSSASAAVPAEAELLGKLEQRVRAVETLSKAFQSRLHSVYYQEAGRRAGSWGDPTSTYRALETSVLAVDAAPGEPHVGFLQGKVTISLLCLQIHTTWA